MFGENPVIPARAPKEPIKPSYEQEVNWKPGGPCRTGALCTLSKFPEFIPDPVKSIERRRPVEGEENPPSFKSTKRINSRPTPSVVTNLKNLKSSFPSVFMR